MIPVAHLYNFMVKTGTKARAHVATPNCQNYTKLMLSLQNYTKSNTPNGSWLIVCIYVCIIISSLNQPYGDAWEWITIIMKQAKKRYSKITGQHEKVTHRYLKIILNMIWEYSVNFTYIHTIGNLKAVNKNMKLYYDNFLSYRKSESP